MDLTNGSMHMKLTCTNMSFIDTGIVDKGKSNWMINSSSKFKLLNSAKDEEKDREILIYLISNEKGKLKSRQVVECSVDGPHAVYQSINSSFNLYIFHP